MRTVWGIFYKKSSLIIRKDEIFNFVWGEFYRRRILFLSGFRIVGGGISGERFRFLEGDCFNEDVSAFDAGITFG